MYCENPNEVVMLLNGMVILDDIRQCENRVLFVDYLHIKS